jgi:hypothetical protein
MILSIRNNNIKGNLDELQDRVDILSQEETLFLQKWENYAKLIHPTFIEYYSRYSLDELVKYFTVSARCQFPIPTSVLGKSAYSFILLYNGC